MDVIKRLRPGQPGTKRLRPGQPGTKRLQRRFGDRLLFVRYRHDAETQRRFTTVELIVDEGPRRARTPSERQLFPRPNRLVQVRLAYEEIELRNKVKAAGGKWNPDSRLWTLPYRLVQTLNLIERIEGDADV